MIRENKERLGEAGPRISICIPTFNRSKMLSELLESILSQGFNNEIEIVISDDASVDDTVEIAEYYREKISHFKLIVQPKNLGLDDNFLAVTQAASAPYIWLMGDDDRIEPGGVKRVLEALDDWPDIEGLTIGVIDYDETMVTPVGLRRMPETQLMRGKKEVFLEMAELLGFMSALIIKRASWSEKTKDSEIINMKNYYVQVMILGRVLGDSGKWGVIKEPIVGFRTGNDQFKTKFGWIDRMKIDIEAYNEISSKLFADDLKTEKRVRSKIVKSHILARLINAKTSEDEVVPKFKVAGILYQSYSSVLIYWLIILPIVFLPRKTLVNMRSIYKRYSNKSGAQRARKLSNGQT